MPIPLPAWLLLGLLAVVVLHELTHVAVARLFGHPTLCVAVNPIGVAILFEDAPYHRYCALQVTLPALVTWLVVFAWLLGVSLSGLQALSAPGGGPDVTKVALSALLVAVLSSGGDIVGTLAEVRRPVWGPARVERDLRTLRRLPSLVFFTAHGERWRPFWSALAESEPGRPALG